MKWIAIPYNRCGAPFEGDQRMMQTAFQRIWATSSESTMLFPGHEYGDALVPQYFQHGGEGARG